MGVRELANQLSAEAPVRKLEQGGGGHLCPPNDSLLDEAWKES
jgi:hypothetical protein